MHHVDLALEYATRIIGNKEGKIVFDGPSKAVTEDVLIKIYGRSIRENEKLGHVDIEDEIDNKGKNK